MNILEETKKRFIMEFGDSYDPNNEWNYDLIEDNNLIEVRSEDNTPILGFVNCLIQTLNDWGKDTNSYIIDIHYYKVIVIEK